MKNNKHGKIILINGTSSSGKSAILKEFQKLKKDYTILKIDDFFPPVLNKKAKELGWNENSGQDPWLFLYEYLFKKTGKYYYNIEARQILFNDSPTFVQIMQKAKELSLNNKNVIIDNVLEFEEEYKLFDDFFKNLKPIKILVYCPLNILLERVQQRNNSGIPEERRTAIQSFEQFPAICCFCDSMRSLFKILFSNSCKLHFNLNR